MNINLTKHSVITVICIGTITLATGIANAATKCVKLTTSTLCGSNSGNGANWSVSCGTNRDIKVQGIGFCSSASGIRMGATLDNVSTSVSTDQHMACWCRMISPAVSKWTFYERFSSAGNCAVQCAAKCAYTFIGESTFRSGMLELLSD